MQLAVLFIDRGALLGYETNTDTLALQALRARTDLRPLGVVARELGRSVPGEVAVDVFSGDDLTDELLVVPGESPHAQGALFAVAFGGRGEILGDSRQEKARISPARGFGDRARLDDDRLRACACEVVRGRDSRDTRADDCDVGRRIVVEARVVVGRNLVEPDARHFHYSALGTAARCL